ncbi:Hypothetical protein A7982_08720 [Minicystis rosea]|nr:Hypothetical protein A7982_08720 [Minicystis rosea]
MTALASDAATVSVFVAVTPEDAFDVFTNEIDLWWRQGPKYRIAGKRRGQLFFEGGVGGRMFETFETTAGSRTIEVGTVLVWDPPRKLELEWRGVNFKPGEKTFVEVSFQPSGEGTMVTVRHHGWAALPDDHPVRHGLTGAAFSRMIGMFWGDLMRSLREHGATRRDRES